MPRAEAALTGGAPRAVRERCRSRHGQGGGVAAMCQDQAGKRRRQSRISTGSPRRSWCQRQDTMAGPGSGDHRGDAQSPLGESTALRSGQRDRCSREGMRSENDRRRFECAVLKDAFLSLTCQSVCRIVPFYVDCSVISQMRFYAKIDVHLLLSSSFFCSRTGLIRSVLLHGWVLRCGRGLIRVFWGY